MFLHAEAFETREEADERYWEVTGELAKYPQLTITAISLSLDEQPLVVVIGDEPPFKTLESSSKGQPILLPKVAWKALVAHHLDQHRRFAAEIPQGGQYTKEHDYGDEGRGMYGDGTMYPS